MGLLDFFRLRSKASDNTFGATWANMFSGNSDAVDEQALLHNNREWVFIAVDKVAQSVAGVRYKVMRYARSGDDTEIFNGPLVEFLEKPGKNFTGKDFIYLNTVYKELTGNAFWERETSKTVRPLLPTTIRPNINDKDEIVSFVERKGGKDRTIPLKDMLHDRYIDPARPYWGAGKLQKIARWVDTSTFADEFLRAFFLNGATFSGFIETEEESMDRMALIKAGLQNDHVGVAKAHKLGVLPKGAKYTKTTANMQEIEMGITDDRYRDKILAGFGVPKSLVGLTDNVQRGNIEAAEYSFAKNTIKPAVDDLIEFLNVYVAKVLDPSGRYYFAYDEFIPKNEQIEIEARKAALGNQAYKTINEVRAEEGLPPVPGGDVIYTPPFQTPLGTTPEVPDQVVGDENLPDEEKPEKAKKNRPRGVSERIRAFEKGDGRAERLAEAFAKKMTEVSDATISADEAAHKDFKVRVDEYQKQLANKVREFNQQQRQQVINRISGITGVQANAKAVSKADVFDDEEQVGLMIDFVGPILRDLLTDQALAEYQSLGLATTFDPADAMIDQLSLSAAKRLAKGYNDTTAKLLKVALNDGLKDGLDLNALTEKVSQVYEFSNTVRAEMVAHTESVYIANKANVEAWRQSGVVRTKRWYTQHSDPCEFCRAMNGKIVDVEELYYKKGDTHLGINGGVLNLDYRSIGEPPLHTNCYCILRPEDIEIGE